MKKFLRNVLVFIAIFWALNTVPQFFLSPYYGNKWYVTKYEYFAKHHQRFNAAIWGSSRIDRHVNPSVLDAALNDYHLSTFNFGTPGTYNPESYYQYEKFLESADEHPIEYAFLEIQPLMDPTAANQFALKSLYWLELKYLRFGVSAALASDLDLRGKTRFIVGYGSCFVSRLLFGWKALYVSDREKRNRLWLGRNKDGFYPLDEELADPGRNSRLKRRHAELLDDPTVLERRVSLVTRSLAERRDRDLNEAHLRKLMELLEKSREKGIYLVFVIPPRLGLRYEKLLALRDRLPAHHVVVVANPKAFPELYQLEYSFDIGHLNRKGADIFTGYLADQLKETVFQNQQVEDPSNGADDSQGTGPQ